MKKTTLYIVLLFSFLAFVLSSVPYLYVHHITQPSHVFLGQIISTLDHNMYFSFIRQAESGHFLFRNRLTYIEHAPVFVNLEFWFVGTLQRITGFDENQLYKWWRILGIVSLVTGFVLNARLLLQSTAKVYAATALFLFSGGIGFIHTSLNLMGFRAVVKHWGVFGYSATSALSLDTSSCIMPFNQMMTNPHFSLPTGIILLGFYYFLSAEMKNNLSHYALSGCFFFLTGLIRPYDILPVVCAIPVYVALTNKAGKFSGLEKPGAVVWRLLPVMCVVPVLAYNVWLFRWHPVFSHWSSQGNNSHMIPSFLVHYVNFGIIGLLALLRVALYKKVRFGSSEIFLSILFVVTLIINHAGHYTTLMPWSFQVGAFAAAPLVLLGCAPEYGELFRQRYVYRIFVTAVALVVVASNLALVEFRCAIIGDRKNFSHMLTSKDEYDSWIWLRNHSRPGEVLLSSFYSSSRIAKYTDLNVVAGHPFVTPEFERTQQIAAKVVFDSVIGQPAWEALQQLRVDYIYIGPTERVFARYQIKDTDSVRRVFSNPVVDIYKILRKTGS